MKPDWKDAPKWAQYLARDPSGAWIWYECKPKAYRYPSEWRSSGRGAVAFQPEGPAWDDTLERRPK